MISNAKEQYDIEKNSILLGYETKIQQEIDIVKSENTIKETINKAKLESAKFEQERRKKAEALKEKSSLVSSLNGLWKFSYAKNYKSAIKGFETVDYCCKDWDEIRVPAHIQMEGYDAPQYANTQYPWEGREELKAGELPTRFNPVASYAKYFEVPENMKAKRVFISFQGAESGIAVWLNGNFVGYSEDTFTPSIYENKDELCGYYNDFSKEFLLIMAVLS